MILKETSTVIVRFWFRSRQYWIRYSLQMLWLLDCNRRPNDKAVQLNLDQQLWAGCNIPSGELLKWSKLAANRCFWKSTTCSFKVLLLIPELPVINTNGDQKSECWTGFAQPLQLATAMLRILLAVDDPTGVRSDGQLLTDPYPVGETTITGMYQM